MDNKVRVEDTPRDGEDTQRLPEGMEPAAAPLEQAPAPSRILGGIQGPVIDKQPLKVDLFTTIINRRP